MFKTHKFCTNVEARISIFAGTVLHVGSTNVPVGPSEVPVRHRKGPPSQKAEKTIPMVMYN